MDSISRSGLLALLNNKTLTQEEIIELVKAMQPLEVDTRWPPKVEPMGSYYPAEYAMWPASMG